MAAHKFFLDLFVMIIAFIFVALVFNLTVFEINPADWLRHIIRFGTYR